MPDPSTLKKKGQEKSTLSCFPKNLNPEFEIIMVSSELKKNQFSEMSDNDLLTLFFALKTNVKFSANLTSSLFLM